MSKVVVDVGRRGAPLLIAGVLSVATVGFLVGTASEATPIADGRARVQVASAESTVPTHAELSEGESASSRAAAARQRAAFVALARPLLTIDAGTPSDEQVRDALRSRAELRAYDGAPPRIPHVATQSGGLDCIACHARGARIGEHFAPPMSHGELGSCTQCHVPTESPGPSDESGAPTGELPRGTTFVGLEPPEGGGQAWTGAPPVIPHPTRMRERCVSCHGASATGLRSGHPWRQSCLQCHAPSARFDFNPSARTFPP